MSSDLGPLAPGLGPPNDGPEEGLVRPRTVGEILDGAFGLYRRHFAPLVGLALVFMVPGLVVVHLNALAGGLLGALGTPFARAACYAYLGPALAGREPRLGAALGGGVRRGPLLLLLGIVANILASLPAMAVGLVLVILGGIGLALANLAGLGDLGNIALVFAIVVAVFAGLGAFLVALTYLAFYGPLWMYEGNFLFVRRSIELVRGAFWKCLLVLALSWLLRVLPAMVLSGAAFLTVGLGDLENFEQHALTNFLSLLLTALVEPFGVAVLVLLYVDRRARREGADLALPLRSNG